MSIKLNGKALSQKIKLDLKSYISSIDFTPCLAVILVGNNPASQVYVRNKQRAAEQIGIKTININYSQSISQKEIVTKIQELNNDNDVDAILVQLPLPEHIDEETIINTISPQKDADGFHPINIGRTFMNLHAPTPCTPAGIMQLLHKYKINVSGKHAVIIGRSNIVGRPISAMLLNENATISITHSKTKNLKEITNQADILVVAIGQPKIITKEYIKPGAVVIDVGINRLENKIVGDVDFESVAAKASYITPVPGGVGPMTIAMLMQQTVNLAKSHHNL